MPNKPEYDLWGAYLALGVQALLPIVLGSYKSLKTPRTTLARRRKAAALNSSHSLLGQEDDEDEDDDMDETVTWSDTLLFPVLGSVVLLSMFFILKYVGSVWINRIIGGYFSIAGMWAFQSTFGSIIAYIIRHTNWKPTTYHVRISSGIRQIFHLPIGLPDLVLFPFAIIVPALYIPLGRPYILSNVLALSLSTSTLALLRLDSFPTAFLLLAVLLVYDIFWVFATPVMVTVAKGIDAPIKILASKTNPFTSTPTEFAMLGLGDIVVPGLVVALCLRFDLSRYAKANPTKDVSTRSSYPKPYFYCALVSYVVGLATTMVVMHWTRRAQPALLYLSPACILGPVILALIRGELTLLRTWSDNAEEDDIAKALIDDSIEPASVAAMKARAEAKIANGGDVDAAEEKAEKQMEERMDQEDDSWMGGSGVVGADESKARKRKGNKKK